MTRACQPIDKEWSDEERIDWLDADWDRLDRVRESLDEQPDDTDIRFVLDVMMDDDDAEEERVVRTVKALTGKTEAEVRELCRRTPGEKP